jgi:penicillin-binding protein 1B
MPIKLRIPTARRSGQRGKGRDGSRAKGLLPRDRIIRFGLLGFLSAALLVVGFFAYWYVKYDRIIEQRFRSAVFSSSAKIFAAPPVVRVGSKMTVSAIAAELRHAGYAEKEGESPLGSYGLHPGSIEVLPGPESYHSPEPATITIVQGEVSSINSRSAGALEAYELEPQMLTSLFNAGERSKRQLVKYDEIPKTGAFSSTTA